MTAARPPGRWIPPRGLVFGQLAHGASWVVLCVLALRGLTGAGLPRLGWLHVVVLGWLTMTALSILVHVIPAFTDATWRAERLARGSLAVYALGVLLLVAGFCASVPQVLPWGGSIVGLGLLGYAVPALVTLAGAFGRDRVEAAIARALTVTLAFLLVTAGLGVALTWALNGHGASWVLAVGPPIHAELGLIGWLTLLAMGVSARTVGPITGGRSRRPARHVAAGAGLVAGTIVLGAGSALGSPAVVWLGMLVLGAAVAVYVVDLAAVLRRATVPHRPPQAFLAASALWLAVAFVLGIGVLRGSPWSAAFVYVVAIGWLGQMVNANLHHIGIRLLATAFRGDDDETGPGELLCAALSWITFAAFQAAVVLGVAGLLASVPALVASAGGAGFAGWMALLANALYAARRASRPPAAISLLNLR